MDYKKIIGEAWQYTQEKKRLIRWFGFLPAVFTTMVSICTLLYQFFSFKESYLFSDNPDGEGFLFEVVNFGWHFLQTHLSWTVPLIIGAVIFGFLYFLYPTLAVASAIQVIARDKNGQSAGLTTGVKYGARQFLPMLEYRAVIKVFSVMFVLFEMAFTLRYSLDFFFLLLPIFILFALAGLVMSLLFTYAEFFIVIDGQSIFESMRSSARLVIAHWKHTFLITLLMLIIGLRIIIQVVLVFLVPVIILLVTGYLSIVLAPGVSLIIGSVLGASGLLFAAYLTGVVEIFSYSVWTFTFLKLTEEKEISAREEFSD